MAGVDYSLFKGKPFQVVSKLGVRYTGIFDHISQEDQTICLAQVYNHGTEDRPTARKLPGSTNTLGWVRFHTESIESLALVDNYVPPDEEAPVDPILASVSQMAPGGKFPSPTKPKPPAKSPSAVESPSQSQSPPVGGTRHNLPAKPTGSALTAVTALDRVQASLSELSVEPRQRRGPPHAGSHLHWQSAPRAVDVPDTEFDFSKGTEKFEKERENRRGNGTEGGEGQGEDGQGVEEVGEPEMAPHPSVVANGKPNGANGASGRNGSGSGNGNGVGGISEHTGGANGLDGVKGSSAYNKGSFFDALTGESSRISRNEERHRNLDTFGEAGGSAGGMGYGMRGRGGYRGGGYGRGGGAAGGYGGGGGGTKNDGYGGQGYRGRGRGGGGGGGYGNRQGYQQPQ